MGVLEEVADLAEAVARRRSLRLWDVQMGGRPGSTVVRVFVDSVSGGVDLDTVADVSEELSRGLDLKDPIPGRYTLEVSSPGLERTLKTPEHFRLSVGKSVVLKTFEPLDGQSHRLEGEIESAGETATTMRTEAGAVDVPYRNIKSARTIFEWK
jgi:ribosome maturation factor RimP